LNGKVSSSKHRPDCFGPFPVRADLGASRFGPVYLGRDPSTNTRVVIRTFEPSQGWLEFGEQSDLLDSFGKLCETTLEHPGLARPLASGAEGDIAYLVYSDLAGTAMDAVMRQDGVRPVAEVLLRARQLAEAIDFAASAGVHHGMMAPCDVILEGERTGVTGFGLAQALIKAGIPAEAVSPYGSPQRLAGAPPTHVDDIYSLAAITLELLIGTPRNPDQDTSRALREAQGLPERRRIPRPAPHETRLFTMIAGVDAGKLRACFAAAFAEEPSERPSTAAEFVASFEDAISDRRVTDEPAPSVVAVPLVSGESEFFSEECEDPPSAPVLDMKPSARVLEMKRAEDGAAREPAAHERATLAPPSRPERVAAEGRAARRRRARERRREKLATSQPLIQESHDHERGERTPESRVARRVPSEVEGPAPAVAVALPAEVTAPRARSIDRTSYPVPVQSESRAFLVASIVAISFAAGFGGGFVVGHFSKPSTESIDVSHHEPVTEPQPPRAAAGEDPKPIASTRQTVAPISEEEGKASKSASIAATVERQRAAPVVESGRLLVRSTPAGASVLVDGQSRGVTPLDLRELAFGAHTIAVSHPNHETRQRRVTLSERRPARSVDFELRATSAPEHATPPTNSTGSLQVASRPSGAQVFVDDDLIGTTPLLLSDVAAGPKKLRIELSGYKSWMRSILIEPSARSRVSASLEP
jgi:serine/threonine protein kinase